MRYSNEVKAKRQALEELASVRLALANSEAHVARQASSLAETYQDDQGNVVRTLRASLEAKEAQNAALSRKLKELAGAKAYTEDQLVTLQLEWANLAAERERLEELGSRVVPESTARVVEAREAAETEVTVLKAQVERLHAEVASLRSSARESSATESSLAAEVSELQNTSQSIQDSLYRTERALEELMVMRTPARAAIDAAYADVRRSRANMERTRLFQRVDTLASSVPLSATIPPSTPPVQESSLSPSSYMRSPELSTLYSRFEELEAENELLAREREALFAELNSSRDSLVELESTFDELLHQKEAESAAAAARADQLADQLRTWISHYNTVQSGMSPQLGAHSS